MTESKVIPLGGGGFYSEGKDSRLDDWLVSLVETASKPSVCFVPTACGDAAGYILEFYEAFQRRNVEASHLRLFRRDVDDLRSFVLRQDIIYVGGGNTANMMAVWREHGLVDILEDAYDEGAIFTGPSAGGICWFDSGVTDSYGTELAPLSGCMGFVEGSFCPHYDGEVDREPAYQSMVAESILPGGYAADDGVGLVFEDGKLVRAVSEQPEGRAFKVESFEHGVESTKIDPEYLG